MPSKEWKADYNGHSIVVYNSNDPLRQKGEAKLYIDGECVDTSFDLIVKDDFPALRGTIQSFNGSEHRVEVYAKSTLFSVKAKIFVDSKQVGGDSF